MLKVKLNPNYQNGLRNYFKDEVSGVLLRSFSDTSADLSALIQVFDSGDVPRLRNISRALKSGLIILSSDSDEVLPENFHNNRLSIGTVRATSGKFYELVVDDSGSTPELNYIEISGV